VRQKVPSAKAVFDTVDQKRRWASVAFTWNGLRALGLDEASLASFPEEFRERMPARWQVLGDTGKNHPDHWIGGVNRPQLHAIAILFARDAQLRVTTERLARQLVLDDIRARGDKVSDYLARKSLRWPTRQSVRPWSSRPDGA
jgi:hypothetical protein